jgi:flagellar assembly protein FliH
MWSRRNRQLSLLRVNSKPTARSLFLAEEERTFLSSYIRRVEDDFRAVRSFELEDLSTDGGDASCDDGDCLLIPSGPLLSKEKGHWPGQPLGQGSRTSESSSQQQAEEIARQAYEKGFAQGHADGQELGRKEMASKIQGLEQILKELSECKARFCLEAEAQVLELTLCLAEEIIRHEARCRPEVVQETVRAALQMIAQKSELKICLNPRDMEHVKEFLPELEHELSLVGPLEVEANPTVGEGGCFVETDCGIVDARLEEQWEVVKARLRQTLTERQRDAGGGAING